MFALHAYERGFALPDYNLTRSTINNNDVDTAKALIAEFGLLHPNNNKPE